MELYTLNVEYQMKILELSSCVPNSAIKKVIPVGRCSNLYRDLCLQPG